jgi:hypothetical protein
MTDVPVISADCAMADDYLLALGLLCGYYVSPRYPLLDLFGPCGLMDYPYW